MVIKTNIPAMNMRMNIAKSQSELFAVETITAINSRMAVTMETDI